MVMRMKTRRRAFTLVELMVTVSIIALLIGLLVPALGSMRRAGWATKSQSNLRQWGMAMDSWAAIHDDTLPWEGSKVAADMGTNLANPTFWPNALAGMLGVDSYATISERAFEEQRNVDNWYGAETVWNDPGAVVTRSEPWSFGDAGKSGLRRQFWFKYGMNYRLNQTLLQQAGVPEASTAVMVRTAHIAFADRTIYMFELRAQEGELAIDDPHRNASLDRASAGWKRYAARYSNGGHSVFADGHVSWFGNEEATTNAQGSRVPSTPAGDWNNGKLIWDPLGPALN